MPDPHRPSPMRAVSCVTVSSRSPTSPTRARLAGQVVLHVSRCGICGCGPVGLAVVCHLTARGVRRVVASDLSVARRALALRSGADAVVDPAEESPYEAASTRKTVRTTPQLFERFVLGQTPLELRDTLHLLAEGELDASPLVTGTVGLDGVAGAFVALAGAEKHATVLVDPSSDTVL